MIQINEKDLPEALKEVFGKIKTAIQNSRLNEDESDYKFSRAVFLNFLTNYQKEFGKDFPLHQVLALPWRTFELAKEDAERIGATPGVYMASIHFELVAPGEEKQSDAKFYNSESLVTEKISFQKLVESYNDRRKAKAPCQCNSCKQRRAAVAAQEALTSGKDIPDEAAEAIAKQICNAVPKYSA